MLGYAFFPWVAPSELASLASAVWRANKRRIAQTLFVVFLILFFLSLPIGRSLHLKAPPLA